MALAAALQSGAPLDSALAAFENARIRINRQVMQRGRDLGSYLGPAPASAEMRREAAQHATPEAVMREIAVLDFLDA